MSDSRVYRRQPNGRGSVEFGAQVGYEVYVDKQSVVSDNCRVFGNVRLENTRVVGPAIIVGTAGNRPLTIVNSTIGEYATIIGTPFISNSLVANCNVHDAAFISRSVLNGGVWVGGIASLQGVTIEDNLRIERGFWKRPPLYMACDGPFDINEAVDGKIAFGCYVKTYEDWLKFYPRWARKYNLTDAEVAEYREKIDLLKEAMDKLCQ